MLDHSRLDALNALLREMTQAPSGATHLAPSTRMRSVENWLMGGFVITMLLFVILAAWYRYTSDTPIRSIPTPVHAIYLVSLLLAVLYLATIAISVVQILRRDRKERFAGLLALLEHDLHRDAEFLARLRTFDRPTLEYGLLQYRHRWACLDGRVALLAGDLRRLGLFPALAAAAISASTLLKTDSSFLWTPVILASCFYLVAFHALGQRERPEQVEALLEYALRHAGGREVEA